MLRAKLVCTIVLWWYLMDERSITHNNCATRTKVDNMTFKYTLTDYHFENNNTKQKANKRTKTSNK